MDKQIESDVTAIAVKDFFNGLSENESVEVFINSFGGNVGEGMAIYNTISSHKGYVTVKIDGFACSIASVIAFAGDKLIVPDNAVMMIHLPWVGVAGNKKDLAKEIQALEVVESSIMSVYSNALNNKTDKETIQNFMNDEKWFDAEEIRRYFKVGTVSHSNVSNSSTDNILARFRSGSGNAKESSEEVKKRILKKVTDQSRVATDKRKKLAATNMLEKFKR